MAGKALSALAATLGLCAANACGDFHCWGVNICDADGACSPPTDCDASAITEEDDVIQIRGSRCRVTMEAIHQALPDSVTKDETEYTLNKKLVIRDDCILEIHGASKASSPDAVVTLLKLKVRETPYPYEQTVANLLSFRLLFWDFVPGSMYVVHASK